MPLPWLNKQVDSIGARSNSCSRCAGPLVIERDGLYVHRTCVRCHHVEASESQRSFVDAMLVFLMRG